MAQSEPGDVSHTTPTPQRQGHKLFPQFSNHICQCSHSPLCRHHHRAKQAKGWRLTQPEPGILVWRVPSGRTYTTTPTEYSM
jgi:hypothetical protein